MEYTPAVTVGNTMHDLFENALGRFLVKTLALFDVL